MQEVREKKKIGNGSFHMRGKGVKHGSNQALRTPFYFLSNKEKKNLNGEVESYNMFTTIIPYNEFKLKDDETQKNLLTKWREVYENDKIMGDMGIGNKTYFEIVTRLELPKKPRGGNKRGPYNRKATAKKAESKKEKTEQIEMPINSPVIQAETPAPQIQKIISKGLYLEYNGEYSAEELNKLFTKLQLLVDGEPNKFNISLSLTEKKK